MLNLCRPKPRLSKLVGASLLACSSIVTPAYAQTAEWYGGHGSDPLNPANWKDEKLPGPSLVTYFDLINGLNEDAPIFEDGDAMVIATGHIGGRGQGRVTVRSGGSLWSRSQLSVGGHISSGDPGGNGTLIITGENAQVHTEWQLFVAYRDHSTGTVIVENGGRLTSSSMSAGNNTGAVAEIIVRSGGIYEMPTHGLINMGVTGTATLNINSGGQVILGPSTSNRMGTGATLLIDGAGSKLTAQSNLWLEGGRVSVTDQALLKYSSFQLTGAARMSVENSTLIADAIQSSSFSLGGNSRLDMRNSSFTSASQLGLFDDSVVTLANVNTNVFEVRMVGNSRLVIGGEDGAPAEAPGTFVTRGISTELNDTRIIFNHNGVLEFGGSISGRGSLFHRAGETRLTNTTVGVPAINLFELTGGTVLVDGVQRANDFNVSGGATLGGSGSVIGKVSIADGIVSPGEHGAAGTLNLSSLYLTPGSILNFDLGAPDGTPGDGSDLIDVSSTTNAGPLQLDGTLNITDIGGFGAGLYRLINYTGTLTDNGLELGLLPAGFSASDMTIVTATARQVNLLVAEPVRSYTFWDGGGDEADGNIRGGNGTWNIADTNWTTADGSRNGAFDPAALLIFAGDPGVVTVDAENGLPLTRGVQFASDGYRITGDTLRLEPASPTDRVVMRVGDGSAHGADYVATIDSVLSGPGGISKTDLGVLHLTAANSYTGGTEVLGGTVRGSTTSLRGSFTLGSGTTLHFEQSNDGIFAGTVADDGTGNATLLKTGAGRLSVAASDVDFGGTTRIEAGSLHVTGAAAEGSRGFGRLVIGNGATLTGTPRVGMLEVVGTVSPGNSPGVMTVDGNLIFRAGSTYAVDLTSSGAHDRINVTGQAVLEGGTVAITTLNPDTDYVNGTVYRILDAAGGVTGTFAALTENSIFLDFTLAYDATGVSVTVSQVRTFPDVASTWNQQEVAQSLRDIERPAGSDGLAVYNALIMLDADDARRAFDASGGEFYASLIGARQRQGIALSRQFVARASTAFEEGVGVWGGVTGQSGHVDGDGNGARFNHTNYGFGMGVDYRGSENGWALGLGGGWQRGDTKLERQNAAADLEGWHFGGYVRFGSGGGGFTLTGAALHDSAALNVSRVISIGPISRLASARSNITTTAATVELRYGLPIGKWAIGPVAGLDYSRSRLDGVEEQGASALNLRAGVNRDAWTRYGIGGFARLKTTDAMFDLSARYLGGDRSDAAATMRLAGALRPFTSYAARGSRSGAEIRANGGFALGGGWSVAGQIGLFSGEGERNLDGNIRVSLSF